MTLQPMQREVETALGFRIVLSRHNEPHLYWLNEDGSIRGGREATTPELKMWELLMTPQERWGPADV